MTLLHLARKALRCACVPVGLLLTLHLAGCSPASAPSELSVTVRGEDEIMGQLSSVVIKAFNADGSELLEHHTFELVPGSGQGNLPLTYDVRSVPDKNAKLRVLALGIGMVDGVERTLVEAQKTVTLASGQALGLELFFANACRMVSCWTELRGSTQTCQQGVCVAIPDAADGLTSSPVGATPERDGGALLDGAARDGAAGEGGTTTPVGMDSAVSSEPPSDAGLGDALDATGPCPSGGALPCKASPDAASACDVGKYVGTFTGMVGPNGASPDTAVACDFAFEVPAADTQSLIPIVDGQQSGKTNSGNTLVARLEGTWNCATRALEARVVDGVFTYVDRVLFSTLDFTGTASGSFTSDAEPVTGTWKVVTNDGAGGKGAFSVHR